MTINGLGCTKKGGKCDLCKGCKTPDIPVHGSLNAELLFVGEAPGEDEDLTGINFIGKSGKLLRDTVLRQLKLKDITTVNVVRCRPPGNRNPKGKEIAACREYLDSVIQNMPNLKVIVAVGNYSLRTVMCDMSLKILSHSGKLLTSPNGMPVMPLMHPSYAGRNIKKRSEFNDHVGRIGRALNGTLADEDDIHYTVLDKDGLTLLPSPSSLVAVDLETSGLNPYAADAEITCIAITYRTVLNIGGPHKGYHTYVIPKELIPEATDILERLFTTHGTRIVGHNIKFDYLWLKENLHINCKNNIYWDTKLAEYAIDETISSDLKDMVWKYTGMGGYEEDLGGLPHEVEGEALYKYCATDAYNTYRIFEIQCSNHPMIQTLMADLLLPASLDLADLEGNGIRVRPSRIDEAIDTARQKVQSTLAALEKSPYVKQWQAANPTEVFNPNSHDQLAEILFKYEGLPVLKLTEKTKKPATPKEVLETLSLRSKTAKLILEYNDYSTLESRYLGNMLDVTTPDIRIHTRYHLTTSVSRTSSSDINLQNLPTGKRDVVGVRRCFIADPDYILVEGDYNQQELRIMAALSGDNKLMEAIKSGDVHRVTAANILGKRQEDITQEERRDIGKTFNFGLIYGLSVPGIMIRLGCTKKKANEFYDNFFNAYPKVKVWQEDVKAWILKHKCVSSFTGRVRHFEYVDFNDYKELGKALNQGINMPIQSLAGDILLFAIRGLNKSFQYLGCRTYISLEIHDSIVLNVHKDEMWLLHQIKNAVEDYHGLVPKNFDRMQKPFYSYPKFNPCLEMSFKSGPSLGEMTELDLNTIQDRRMQW